MSTIQAKGALAILLACGLTIPVHAQDSVANTPGTGGDAIATHGTQTLRYVVDLVPVVSAWGNEFQIGPILKASRDADPLFNTLVLGSHAVSPDLKRSVSLGGSVSYSVWNSRGAGVSPQNSAPGSTSVNSFDRQFGVGVSDLNASQTNAIGAIIGVRAGEPDRLYVRRTMGAQSRLFQTSADNGTISLGSIDADGSLLLRADGFNSTSSNVLAGDNIVRVSIPNRSTNFNGLTRSGGVNTSFDTGATTYILNAIATTLNTPAVLPTSLAGTALALSLDFANGYRAGNAAAVNTHIDLDLDAQRGNPTFSTVNSLGGVGTIGSLGRSITGGGTVDSINLFAINAGGAVVNTVSATLPSPMPGFPTLNASGDASFDQYLSQVSFRGPNGLAAIGFDPSVGANGALLAAATATDPSEGEFIAAATIDGSNITWGVVAREGQQVRNAPAGSVIGSIAPGTPVTFSAPGADVFGNVYFVANYQPTVGAPRAALFKAVRDAGTWNLELLLQEGQQITGANSTVPYTIERIVLGDADSIASGGFHAGSILQGLDTAGLSVPPDSPRAFGGALVSAVISYNNLGVPEQYEAVLWFAGRGVEPAPTCPGDINGDGFTDLNDFAILALNFGITSGATQAQGDLNGDGAVNLDDFAILAIDFGCSP